MSGLAICSINGYTLPTSGTTGINVAAGSVITIALSIVGSQWNINCTSTDGYNPNSTISLVQATKIQNFTNNTCQFTIPTGSFCALQFTSTINNDLTTTFKFGVFVTINGLRAFFPGENFESNITVGVAYDLNALLAALE